MDQVDYIIKIILIGDSGVGKSSICNMYFNNEYNNHYIQTIGVDFLKKNIEFDNYKIKLQVWDTAGQERFYSLTSCYYRNVNIILLTYDRSDANTIRRLNDWIDNVENNIYHDKYIFILVGNKTDIDNMSEEELESIQKFVETKNIHHLLVSSKNKIQVDQLFYDAVKIYFDHFQISDCLENPEPSEQLSGPLAEIQSTKKSCCWK